MFLLLFGLIVRRAIRTGRAGMNPHVLTACAVGALTIPSISHDYKLTLMALPVLLLLETLRLPPARSWRRSAAIVCAFLLASAFALIQISYVYRPPALRNSFPILALILACATVLSYLTPDPLSEASGDERP